MQVHKTKQKHKTLHSKQFVRKANAPELISEHAFFHNFLGEHAPSPPSLPRVPILVQPPQNFLVHIFAVYHKAGKSLLREFLPTKIYDCTRIQYVDIRTALA